MILTSACSWPQFSITQTADLPTDAQVAASPTQIVALNNGEAQIYNRSTGAVLTGDPTMFFSNFGGGLWGPIFAAQGTLGVADFTGCCSDSRIRFDASVSRWYRTGLCSANLISYELCLAVSLTADATAGWYLGVIASDPHDFMRLAFTQSWIVSLNNNMTATFVNKAAALSGDFRNPLVQNFGMPWAVPVQTLTGTSLPMFLSIESTPTGPLWRVWWHDPIANTTLRTAPAPVADPEFMQPSTAWTPSGTITAGQLLTEAWQSVDGNWVVGTGIGTFFGDQSPHAYLITLDGSAGYDPSAGGSTVRWVAEPTIHPAVAISPITGTIVLTAIGTSQTMVPTHVFALTSFTVPGLIDMNSVEDAAAYIGHPNFTPTGNGSGPVPLAPYGTINIRGPDYLDAVPDPSNSGGVWFVGQWVSGNQWWEHVTWWR